MNIEEKVIDTLKKSSSVADAIEREDLLSYMGIDSLKLVEVIIALEDTFNIEFNLSSLNPSEIRTVKDLIDLVDGCLTK